VIIAVVLVALVLASLPYWLPRSVVALRMWLFARINGAEGIAIPGDLVDASRFLEVYSHPAARGRSRGAALSDLFWYWLSPGPEVHQEHLEPEPRYDEVARCTRRILTMPSVAADRLAVASVRAALPSQTGLVRLRDLVMPVWAELYHRVVFGRPATDEVRALIVTNANDVVTALKCCGLRHMDRRLRLTAHLEQVLDQVPHELPSMLDHRERALYLQGTFFNTAVVQSSEATAHMLMVLASDRAQSAADEQLLDKVFEDTLRRFPLFGVAHRVTTADISLSRESAAGRLRPLLQLSGLPPRGRLHSVRRGRQPSLPRLAHRPRDHQGRNQGAARPLHVRHQRGAHPPDPEPRTLPGVPARHTRAATPASACLPARARSVGGRVAQSRPTRPGHLHGVARAPLAALCQVVRREPALTVPQTRKGAWHVGHQRNFAARVERRGNQRALPPGGAERIHVGRTGSLG